MKKIIKILVDILMYADFLFLMNHGVVRLLNLHGIFGICLFGLFIVHHLLNVGFYKVAFKGKWNKKRIVLNVTDWLLFILMILMAISSVMMSGLVFDWSVIRASQTARVIHLMSTSWAFMVMSFHLSLHTSGHLKKIERNCNKWQKVLFYAARVLIVALGIFCFIKSELYVFMFNTGGWKMAAPNVVIGFLEYIAITAGVCAIGGGVRKT